MTRKIKRRNFQFLCFIFHVHAGFKKHYLVKFSKDQELAVVRDTQVKTTETKGKKETTALWLPNFRWYTAKIISEGSK